MTEISYNWRMMSDDALIELIGKYIRHQRLVQNKSQKEIASNAGVSRSTLSLLESGEKITMSSFLKVMRELDLLHLLEVFKIQETLSPIALAKLEKEKRQRASKSASKPKKQDSEW